MSIASFLEVERLRFLEPDYASLVNQGEPGVIISQSASEISDARILMDEEGNPVVFAVKAGEEWVATCWSFRSPTQEEIALFEKLDGGLFQEKRSAIDGALRAHFTREMVKSYAPAGEDLTEERIGKVRSLLAEYFGTNLSGTAIDGCAGSGIGSMIMRELGASPLAYDNDPELLALGLSLGRLHEDETLWIDGRSASAYLPDAKYGVGIMFGQMYNYTKDVWQPIVEELAGITEKTLITVATREEAEWVCEWAEGVGRKLSVYENERDPIYDRWVCFG
ncbi:MAG TPA: hypothetical protein O0X39_06000 [Methanocorpusculum sp.]|nr:hypothetical protein [Methanocorpusculum sp.]